MIGIEAVNRQRHQLMLFLCESLGDCAGSVVGKLAGAGDVVTPLQRLTVEVRKSGEGPRGEERIADIADGSFNPPLFVPGTDLTRFCVEVVMSLHFYKARIEMYGIAATFEYDAAEVVIK